MIQKIKTIKPTVKKLLLENRLLSDDEKALNWAVWEHIMSLYRLDINRISFDYMTYKSLPSESSIQRVRRKLEAEYPELRGNTYYERRFVQEPEVREGINQ